ncbi:MAG: RsmD family RNA methyltransferase [Pirellulales bacterium]|nr:RsmD family RNA methyltransferase [Pirellulales bacterium]
MMKNGRIRSKHGGKAGRDPDSKTGLRIIGGLYRGRRLTYLRRESTRPMKHRVREAVFNLVGGECLDRYVLDLFAGTGAVGLEAISRGAIAATLVERHIPTARIIRENIDRLGVGDQVELHVTSAFLWTKRDLPVFMQGNPPTREPVSGEFANTDFNRGSRRPWIVFICPPYELFVTEKKAILDMIQAILQSAPCGSTLVVEADERFDFEAAPSFWGDRQSESFQEAVWDIRSYPPTVVGVLRHPIHPQQSGS